MKLAAIGSNCIDYYANYNGGTAFAGGGPVNMAVYFKRIGGESSYIGPVGDDKYGHFIIDQLNKKGVDTSHIRIETGKTAVSQVNLVNDERVFGDYEEGVMAANKLIPKDLAFLETHEVVVCDLWGHLERALGLIKDAGVKVAFDCADRPDDPISQTAFPNVDYLFFSSEEGDSGEVRNKMATIYSKGPNLVIAMLGTEGSLCFDGAQYHKYGLYPAKKKVDSMGAGDSYIAGFLNGKMKGLSIKGSMELGAKTAAETISYFGAWN